MSNILSAIPKGQLVKNGLLSIAKDHKVDTGWLMGIGAVEDVTLAYFDRDEKRYIEKQLDGVYELISMQGNITQKKGQAFCHIHVTISDSTMNTFSGHLIDATVAVTLEFCIIPHDTVLDRSFDSTFNLYLLTPR